MMRRPGASCQCRAPTQSPANNSPTGPTLRQTGGGRAQPSRVDPRFRLHSGRHLVTTHRIEGLDQNPHELPPVDQNPQPVVWAPSSLNATSWADVEDDDDDFYANTVPLQTSWNQPNQRGGKADDVADERLAPRVSVIYLVGYDDLDLLRANFREIELVYRGPALCNRRGRLPGKRGEGGE